MKNRIKPYITVAALFMVATLLAGCGGASNTSGGASGAVKQGVIQNVATGSTVTLDASTAAVTDGVQTYHWTLDSKPAGSNASLSDPSSPLPTFTADLPGTYIASVQLGNSSVIAGVGLDSTVTYTITAGAGNVAPVANAGPAQNTLTGNVITLNGSASSDANADALTYHWSLIGKPVGSFSTLASATTATPTFSADLVGTYIAQLIVNDGSANSAPAFVSVTITTGNAVPAAHAGVAQSVIAGAVVTLNGSASSDANSDPLTYKWNWTYRPTGSSTTLLNATTATPTFAPDLTGIYVANLTVNDGAVSSAPVTVVITATAGNAIPFAHAGIAQNVTTGSRVTLNGSASSDANGDALTYYWSFIAKPAGSQSALSSASIARPNFSADLAGTYVAKLVVNDGKVSSAAATVIITATTGSNAIPVANAGAMQNIYSGHLVTLDGSASSDANNDPLTYNWTLISKPTGSTATLVGNTSVAPNFTADLPGTYVGSLLVKDGKVNSAASTVLINAVENVAPVAIAGVAQYLYLGAVVTLNGYGSDTYNDPLTYSWTLSGIPAGSNATLSNATSISPSFTADKEGIYYASLVVNDGVQDSAVSTMPIYISIPPYPAGYVSDSGLIWTPPNLSSAASSYPGTYLFTWHEAQAFCANFSVNNVTGWRLPTYSEAWGLHLWGAANGHGWGVSDSYLWTSDPNGPGSHIFVGVFDGYWNGNYDSGVSNVSCVR